VSTTFLWHGAMTHNSFWVRGRCTVPGSLVVAEEADTTYANAIEFGPYSLGTYDMLSIRATGLSPDTAYRYAFKFGGVVDTAWQGVTRTFPTPMSTADGIFIAGTCAGNNDLEAWTTSKVSDHPIFDDMRLLSPKPRFIFHGGDFHYRDYATNNADLFRGAYWDVLTYNRTLGATARQAKMYRDIPVAYVWDDHDFGPSNSNKTTASKPAAQQAYRDCVPHYTLPADSRPGGNGEIYQTFAFGRQRFILLDTRSERDPQANTDNASKSMLGADQKAWLKETLLATVEPVIFIFTGVPWVAVQTAGADTWGGYTTERQELVDFIIANGLSGRVWFFAGDMHGIAVDNGTNLNNQTGLNRPTIQAAAFDANPSTKGGPYTQGPLGKRNAFGLFSIFDNGGQDYAIAVSLREWFA
jgi:phosphodiesterase/alkaline phosphatase D-like protein